jgi:hypothetical protein
MGRLSGRGLALGNSMTSPFLWALCMLSAIPALLFYGNTLILSIFLAVFVLSYVVLYWRIVRFRSPWWLRFGASRPELMIEADNQGYDRI